MNLTEIYPKLGLTARTVEIDRTAKDPKGQPVSGLPAGVEIASNAFSSDVGVENEPLQVPGGGYLWFEVVSVKPARDRTLDEVKAEVEQRWRDAQVGELVKQKAAALIEKIKGGASLADAAKADGLAVKTTFGLKRAGSAGGLAPSVVQAVFRAQKGTTGSAEGANPTEWVVFHLTDITVPPAVADTPEAKRVEDTMKRALTEDLLSQYVLRLQSDIGATINMDALRRVNAPGDQN
jgi:peptidyl-prolyl cis-trans isomerase D